MLFHNYLEKLLGSKIKIKILRTFVRFETKKFTSRELAEYIHTSHSTVLNSIQDLEAMNIIQKERYGNSTLISMNRNSYSFNLLKEIFTKETETLTELIKTLNKDVTTAEVMLMFGSIVRAQEEMNSDIDLLVITKKKIETELLIAKIQNSITKKFGNILAAQIMTRREFEKKKNSPFIKDLLKEYKLIKGEL